MCSLKSVTQKKSRKPVKVRVDRVSEQITL